MTEKEFLKTLKIVKKLRKKCPWDKKQTHKSLKGFVVEESYELVDAIESRDSEKLKDELGDLLLQVFLHSVIAEEKKEFYIKDVLKNLQKKLIRRHPHVFSDKKVKDEFEVLKNWVEIKKDEKKTESIMDILSLNQPSMILAHKVQKKASSKKFEWENIDDVYKKLQEEIEELKKSRNIKEIEEEIGDIFFTLVHVASKFNVDSEIALRKSVLKFIKRFKRMEALLKKDGKNFENVSLKELDGYWNRVKRSELKDTIKKEYKKSY